MFNFQAFLREFVCDFVICFYKIGEALLDTTIRPYVISAVCGDLFNHPEPQDHWVGWVKRGGELVQVERRGIDFRGILQEKGYNQTDVSVCYRLKDLPEVSS